MRGVRLEARHRDGLGEPDREARSVGMQAGVCLRLKLLIRARDQLTAADAQVDPGARPRPCASIDPGQGGIGQPRADVASEPVVPPPAIRGRPVKRFWLAAMCCHAS